MYQVNFHRGDHNFNMVRLQPPSLFQAYLTVAVEYGSLCMSSLPKDLRCNEPGKRRVPQVTWLHLGTSQGSVSMLENSLPRASLFWDLQGGWEETWHRQSSRSHCSYQLYLGKQENRDGETGSAEEIWRVALPRQPLIHGSHNWEKLDLLCIRIEAFWVRAFCISKLPWSKSTNNLKIDTQEIQEWLNLCMLFFKRLLPSL